MPPKGLTGQVGTTASPEGFEAAPGFFFVRLRARWGMLEAPGHAVSIFSTGGGMDRACCPQWGA